MTIAKELLIKHEIPLPIEDELPLGGEIVSQYLAPLSSLPEFKPHIHLNSKVISIGRKGLDKVKTFGREDIPFVIHVQEGNAFHMYETKAVIDATGTWQNPNPIGSGGIDAEGEQEAKNQIYYGIPDVLGKNRKRYEGKTTLVVGGGHSAINALLELAELQKQNENTKLVWALRKNTLSEAYGGKENDALPARGKLGSRIQELVQTGKVIVHTPLYIHSIQRDSNHKLSVLGVKDDENHMISGIDEIISNTGSRPNFNMLKEIRHASDPSLESVPELAELIDPNIHSCGTVRPHGEKELRQPEKNFYIIGAKSYGRAPTFLLATGYEQARSVVAYLTGDIESSEQVQLRLPETGVCSISNVNKKEATDNASCDSEQLEGKTTVGCC
ncbi:NAD(P)-binding domain-containing protein [Chengkuizengella axinellae]|uniref:NAD(P)-binding domain-containing protein n=1 Tax=Chengkuizengella axinellae TaxID=3064388 RepID=A0ABT9J226_9BACL|nr:NAD(P)-binding domain-containing protein [Chengkuizengella sp. 2205SS18-9]MDP5275663.1 NAD(P)-binding domain-containing protein [Chengkuizengella sp. 2205SS18-9]